MPSYFFVLGQLIISQIDGTTLVGTRFDQSLISLIRDDVKGGEQIEREGECHNNNTYQSHQEEEEAFIPENNPVANDCCIDG